MTLEEITALDALIAFRTYLVQSGALYSAALQNLITAADALVNSRKPRAADVFYAAMYDNTGSPGVCSNQTFHGTCKTDPTCTCRMVIDAGLEAVRKMAA